MHSLQSSIVAICEATLTCNIYHQQCFPFISRKLHLTGKMFKNSLQSNHFTCFPLMSTAAKLWKSATSSHFEALNNNKVQQNTNSSIVLNIFVVSCIKKLIWLNCEDENKIIYHSSQSTRDYTGRFWTAYCTVLCCLCRLLDILPSGFETGVPPPIARLLARHLESRDQLRTNENLRKFSPL